MKNVPENELFSAYLDGEATAEEQVEVEQLLASSPEARRMLDQLRALSLTLQSLPAAKAPVDFGDRVLRAAERRMLSDPAEAPTTVAPVAKSTMARGFVRRFTRPRVLVWAAATIAVALGLSQFGPKKPAGPTGQGTVAQGDNSSADNASPAPGGMSIGPAPGGKSMQAGPLPSPSSVIPGNTANPPAPGVDKPAVPETIPPKPAAAPDAVSIVNCELRGDVLDTAALAEVLDKLHIAWPKPDATAVAAAAELRVRVPLSLAERTMVIARLQKQTARVVSVTLAPDPGPRPTDTRFPVEFVFRKATAPAPGKSKP